MRCLTAAFVLVCLAAAPVAAEDLKGKLLVASPDMPANPFARTVVLMLAHGETGSMGLVVNRALEKGRLGDLVTALGLDDAVDAGTAESDMPLTLMTGGPVEPNSGFILHSDDVMLDSSETLASGVAVTGDMAMLDRVAAGRGPAQVMFLLGYAGWGPGQLNSEFDRGDWDILDADPKYIFELPPRQRWAAAHRALPVDL